MYFIQTETRRGVDVSSTLMKTSKSQPTAEQLTKNAEPTRKYILHPETEKKPQRDGRRGCNQDKIKFQIQFVGDPQTGK